MSTTISAVIINLLVMVLPFFGISIGEDALMGTIQTVTAVVTGLWIWNERRKRGDVNILGLRIKA